MDLDDISEVIDKNDDLMDLFHRAQLAYCRYTPSNLPSPHQYGWPCSPDVDDLLNAAHEERKSEEAASASEQDFNELLANGVAELSGRFIRWSIVDEIHKSSSPDLRAAIHDALEHRLQDYLEAPAEQGRIEALRVFSKAYNLIQQEREARERYGYSFALRKLARIWQSQVDQLDRQPPFRLLDKPDYSGLSRLRQQQDDYLASVDKGWADMRKEREEDAGLLRSIADLDPDHRPSPSTALAPRDLLRNAGLG